MSKPLTYALEMRPRLPSVAVAVISQFTAVDKVPEGLLLRSVFNAFNASCQACGTPVDWTLGRATATHE